MFVGGWLMPAVAHAAELASSAKRLAAVVVVLGFVSFAGTLVNLVHAERPSVTKAFVAKLTLIAAVAALAFVLVSFIIERTAAQHPLYFVIPALTCVLWLLSSLVVMHAGRASQS